MTECPPQAAPYALLTILALSAAMLGTSRSAPARRCIGWLTAAGAIAALALSWTAGNSTAWSGAVRFDDYSKAFSAVFLAALALVSVASSQAESKTAGEYYALLTLSTMGLMLMGSAGGLLTLYLGLELSTISLIALTGFARRERRSAEAALKFLILGSVASAVVLYGASILYGVLGTTQFDGMASALGSDHAAGMTALWIGIIFVIGGLAFKVAAVPFHLWAPDVYEGSPSLVTAFLSTASKAGGFAALIRFLAAMNQGDGGRMTALIVGLAALSMIVGNLAALQQKNLKRLLGYSGIAQSGYILVAIAAGVAPGRSASVAAALMYLLLYALTNIGAFLVAQAVYDATGSDQVAALKGLHRRNPMLAFSAVVVMFSLGGIPPLAGFVGKLYLFAAAWDGGQKSLVLLGALASVIALYYYLMVVRQIYINDPADERKMAVSRPLAAAMAVCILGILAIGIYPRPWVEMGERAAYSITAYPNASATVKADQRPALLLAQHADRGR